jgi:2-polyprenyl-3-methyl-5-hydroxy-6-metoxy-1,4-benzoquinol methylase
MIEFVCPGTHAVLRREGDRLVSTNKSYPIIEGIPRFIESEDYAESFGIQWSIYTDTQLDSHTGTEISRARLERCLGTTIESVQGKTVLEAGCGAGRFTELLVRAGARVHAIDMSRAVEANRQNVGDQPNYRIAQADMLHPPFPPESFALVLCLGVLQHTPSPEASIRSLWSMVRSGGELVIDHYSWTLSRVTKLDTFLRPLLKRMPPRRAHRVTDRLVRVFFPLHWAVRNVVPAQMLLSRVSPVQVYFRAYPELSREEHYEWARLDTFDHLTDRYKRLRTKRQIHRCLAGLGALDIAVWRGGNGIEARCRKGGGPAGRPITPDLLRAGAEGEAQDSAATSS